MKMVSFPAYCDPLLYGPSPVGVRRVSPKEDPRWDGLSFRVGPWGFSLNWQRRR